MDEARGKHASRRSALEDCILKILAVANQKGGVGKTTTTVNLSACLAQMGKRVLAIDVDPQGNCTSGCGVDKEAPEQTVYDVMIEGAPVKDVIVQTPLENLWLLPARKELSGAEVELVSRTGREGVLKRALAPVADDFDFAFIDCPPSLGLLTVNALTASDALLSPIQCEYYALEGLSDLMNTVKLVRGGLNPRLSVDGVVLTMFDARTNLSAQVVAEVKRHFQDKVYSTIIPRSVRLSEAPSFGQPITVYDPRCTGAQAYTALAKEFLGRNS